MEEIGGKQSTNVKHDALLAAAILAAYPPQPGVGLPEIEDISSRLYQIKSCGIDIGDISLRRIPGGFYSEDIEILLGHFLDSDFAEQKSPVILKPEGLDLLRQIVREEREINPEGLNAIEEVLGKLSER